MKNLFTPSALYLLIGLFFITSSPLFVKSQIVSAPAGGLWTSGTTWVGGIVPGAADNVVIASAVTVNGNACNNMSISSGGLLRNYTANTYLLTVNGNLTNSGIISNNVSYNLIVNVLGNVSNNGVMSNNTLTLSGSNNQQISSTQPLEISNFTKNLTLGRAIATTNLNFVGTNINLLSDTLEFTTGNTLTISGGYLINGVIIKSSLPALQINAGSGTYASGLTIDANQTQLYGTLMILGSACTFRNNIFNFGILQNHPSNTYPLTIVGNFTNNGTVQDNVYNINLNISGNLENNGTWTNETTTLNGIGNQDISMTQLFGGSNFVRNASAGRVRATTGLNFVGTVIDFNNDTLQFTTGNAISLSGGYLIDGVLYKVTLPALQFTSGSGTYLSEVTINSPQTELYGIVMIYGNNNNFGNNVINFGTLQNRPSNAFNLTVNGNFTNNGIVNNNVYNFNINISGNLANNGTWTNNSTILNGNGNQELVMSQPFGGTSFTKTSSTGRAIATTGLSFVGTLIDFNADTLQFTTGNALTMSGGYLSSCILFKTALPAIQLTCGNGNYLSALTIDAPRTELYGSVHIYSSNIFKTNVINNGALQNRPVNTYTLPVIGDFTNNGNTLNNVYNFSLEISGNVTNNGTWANRQTTLTGTNTHTMTFSNRFEGDLFTNANIVGSMISTSDIMFDGTTIDLNDCSFSLATGSVLSVMNGSLSDAVISGSLIRFHSLGAYCLGVVFNSDVTLNGVFQAGSGVSFNGSIINDGVMRNRGINSYQIQVQGGLENNGSVMNNVYNFTVTVFGDISNNGVWSNYLTILDGTTDQNVFLINGSSIQSQIRLDANFTGSSFAWWGPQGNLVGNPGYSGANTQNLNFLNPVTDAFAGQYYCINNLAVHSRNVFIQSQTNQVRMLSLNFLLEGLYNSNGLLNPSLDATGTPVWSSGICDQITVELHDIGNFSNIIYTKDEVLLSTDGSVNVAVPATYNSSYYIAIRHRSGIITVSATPVSFTTPQISYSFDVASKAFGNNMALMPDGWYAFYGGDVNQDGTVDTGDMTPVDNGSAAFLSGYRNPDANGDGIIDTGDMTIIDNNSSNFVSAVFP
ncbi:MAG: hypothetical protein V1775_06120 [Bacteroidota bacterium]